MKIYVRSDTSNNEHPEFRIGSNGILYKYTGNSKIVHVPNGVKDINGKAFMFNEKLEKVVLPEGVENIYYSAFEGCKSLETIVFPPSLKFIGANAFDYCLSLKQVTIPENVEQIYNEAFAWCNNLEIVRFEGKSKLSSIGKDCFTHCISLTTIHVPDSVQAIGSHAFSGCISLHDVKLPNIRISKTLFENTGLSSDDFKKGKLNLIDDENDRNSYQCNDRSDDQSIDDWYMSSDGEIDNDKFAEKLENLVKKKFNVSYYFEEPSIQGFAGSDIIIIRLDDNSKYSFSFSWSEMQEIIYADGPEAAANHYFSEIRDGIESGSASTDIPTL